MSGNVFLFKFQCFQKNLCSGKASQSAEVGKKFKFVLASIAPVQYAVLVVLDGNKYKIGSTPTTSSTL